MIPVYRTKKGNLYQGDCLEVLRGMQDNTVDAVVTDPPYGWRFMGQKWDYDIPAVEIWQEVLRVLKPGGHALVACGTRTQHRMACNIEDAGFEIRDVIAWLYGSGFPKSLDVSKAIEKVERGAMIRDKLLYFSNIQWDITVPATEVAKQWEGWGTALKPAREDFTLARKPLQGTVAENVLEWGTGGLNIDGCRIPTNSDTRRNSKGGNNGLQGSNTFKIRERKAEEQIKSQGRFPANVIHDGSNEVCKCFPNFGAGKGGDPYNYAGREYNNKESSMFNGDKPQSHSNYNDSGSAARFFYTAKASPSERRDNNWPTVKPYALIKYLVRLITPPMGIVLDPFVGSGTTAVVCEENAFRWIAIDKEQEAIDICLKRLKQKRQGNLMDLCV